MFGVSLGLLVGIAFFIFKIDDYLSKFTKPSLDDIKITEQTIIVAPKEEVSKKNSGSKKTTVNVKNSPTINYNEVDALIQADDVTVAQEELLSVKNIKVIDLDGKTKRDTLVGQLAGVTSPNFANMFFVEFWKTPLNSKGYRMTRNRVILYGLSDFNSITIYKVDGSYYLKNEEVVYKISSGTEFKPMELVTNTELLTKIN